MCTSWQSSTGIIQFFLFFLKTTRLLTCSFEFILWFDITVLAARKPDFVVCEEQRLTPDWAFVQSVQNPYYSFSGKHNTYICYLQYFNTLVSLCSWDSISSACRWWPVIECWLIFQGIWTTIIKKTYIFVIFQGAPDTLSPLAGKTRLRGFRPGRAQTNPT